MSFADVPFQYLGVGPKAACEFFAAFSRVEYALKAANLRRPGRLAQPSWDAFALTIADDFAAAAEAEKSPLASAVGFMLEEPPQRQVQDEGRMEWAPFQRRADTTDLQYLFDLVKQVRNNLFHGGKYIDGQKDRDAALIAASMAIMEAAVNMSVDVKGWYFNIA